MTDDDRDALCDFVIWRLRERDLPEPVARAAARLADRFPRRRRMGGYLEAQFSVSGVYREPREDGRDTTEWCRAFGRQDALDMADRLICDGAEYVLIQRDSRS